MNFLTAGMLFEKAVATSFIIFEQKHQFLLEIPEMCSSLKALTLILIYKLHLNLIFTNTRFFFQMTECIAGLFSSRAYSLYPAIDRPESLSIYQLGMLFKVTVQCTL